MDTNEIISTINKENLSEKELINLSASVSKKLVEKDEMLIYFLFDTNEGGKFLNEYFKYIYKFKKEIFGSSVPDNLIKTIKSNLGRNDNTVCFNNSDLLGIYTTNISSLFVTEATKNGDIEKVTDCISKIKLKENDLLSIVSGALTGQPKLKCSTVLMLKEKINEIGEDPESFMLFSYLALSIKKDKKRKYTNEVFYLINEHLRFTDLEDLINNSEKKISFGLGYKTKEITEYLINKTTSNKIEDMKNVLNEELSNSNTTSKKMKI